MTASRAAPKLTPKIGGLTPDLRSRQPQYRRPKLQAYQPIRGGSATRGYRLATWTRIRVPLGAPPVMCLRDGTRSGSTQAGSADAEIARIVHPTEGTRDPGTASLRRLPPIRCPGEADDCEPPGHTRFYGNRSSCPLSRHPPCLPRVSWEAGGHCFVISKRPARRVYSNICIRQTPRWQKFRSSI